MSKEITYNFVSGKKVFNLRSNQMDFKSDILNKWEVHGQVVIDAIDRIILKHTEMQTYSVKCALMSVRIG